RHAFAPTVEGGLGLHRLGAGCDIDNVASQRVLRRVGFRLLGIERSSVSRADGPSADGPLFELLSAEYAAHVASAAPWQPGTAGERAAYLGAPATLEGERIRV